MTECWVLNVYPSQKFKRAVYALKGVFDPEAQVVGQYLRWPAHQFEIGFCVRCGQGDPSKVLGDTAGVGPQGVS